MTGYTSFLTRIHVFHLNLQAQGSDVMQRQVSEIKEVILSRIVRILRDVYQEPPAGISFETVYARLAFKSDPHLNELRLALERIERGEYGNCIFCKKEIQSSLLLSLPTAHFCESCAAILRNKTHTGATHDTIHH